MLSRIKNIGNSITSVRSTIYIFISFLSAFGDSIMLLSVPNALGGEFKDVRPAVFMWLIPAVAMFLASFSGNIILRRKNSERVDYGVIILVIAIIEILTAILGVYTNDKNISLLLAIIFVFFYAFIKEGIPKLFYNVQVFRYFCSQKEYKSLVGQSNASIIAAYILSGIVSYYLVENLNWKMALVIDAFTFIVYGGAVIFLGRDYKYSEDETNIVSKNLQGILQEHENLKLIAKMTPMIFAINALSWNYLPLIIDRYNISTISLGVLFISIFKVPGVLLSIFSNKITKLLHIKYILLLSSGFFLFFNWFLHIVPNEIIFFLIPGQPL